VTVPKPDPNQLIDEIAAIIRRVDGNNQMPPGDLGIEIARQLNARGGILVVAAQFRDIVALTNPNKTLGAGRLAERIVEGYWGVDVI
jgi:hypothetical protein